MINQVFAQNFVKKMYRQMQLKVNVMNDHGVIIASADPERVGDFHMCAYEIIEQGLNMSVTTKPTRDLIGVNAPGVNMRLVNNHTTIGVIGVSGDPEQVTSLAKMVKLTFETMYEYEYKRKKQQFSRDSLSDFAYTLIFETPVRASRIARAAKHLRLKDEVPRIPIYITIPADTFLPQFMEWYSASSFSRSQDMLLPLENGVLLCKTGDVDEIADLREFPAAFIHQLQKEFFLPASQEHPSADIRFYVAPTLTDFMDYHRLYPLFQLLAQRTEHDSRSVYYLSDYLLYFMVQQCHESIRPLLSYACRLVSGQLNQEQFFETVSGLVEADMKAETAAAVLHLHKNSVLARVKKIKEVLLLSPLSSARDAAALTVLYELMRVSGYSPDGNVL